MDERPRNLKAMLSEAKDTSELMVDLGYAAIFFADERMADEVHDLEERLTDLIHEMREICVLAGRSKRDAEQIASVLHVRVFDAIYAAHKRWLRRVGGHPLEAIRKELHGHNLSCYCDQSVACHADIYLEILSRRDT